MEEEKGMETTTEPSEVVKAEEQQPNETASTGKEEVEVKPNPKWMSQLSKELRDNEKLKEFSSLNELASAVLSKEGNEEKKENSSVLEDVLNEPNEEEWVAFKKEFVKEGNNPQLDKYVEFVKGAKLTPKQAKALLENANKQQTQTMEDAPKKCREFLQQQWGKDYDKGMQNAKKGAQKILSDDEFSKGFKSHYANDPFAIELLRRVGNMLEEPPKAFQQTADHKDTSSKSNDWGIPVNLFNK